jgi:hypothetical protein
MGLGLRQLNLQLIEAKHLFKGTEGEAMAQGIKGFVLKALLKKGSLGFVGDDIKGGVKIAQLIQA